MAYIRTVMGDISPDKLGITYSHEHIFCKPPYWKERNEEDFLLDDLTNPVMRLNYSEKPEDAV